LFSVASLAYSRGNDRGGKPLDRRRQLITQQHRRPFDTVTSQNKSPFKAPQLVTAHGYTAGHNDPDSTLCSANHHGHIYCNAVVDARLKGKLIPVRTIEGIWGSGGIAPLILNHNTGK
jgi:hypothetical protein